MIRGILKEGCHFVAIKKRTTYWIQQTMSCYHSGTTTPTAGIIVIGDEILKGQVKDTNSHFIISRLYNIGVRVLKVSVIGDDIEEICNEVRKFSDCYTYVITSGGIGPTHDDVTFEGVAKAFKESVFLHPELVKICSEFYNTTDLTSPAMKLASVPKSARLKYGFDPVLQRRAKYPNISIKNVYIFPGVPPLLEKSFTMLCEDLFGGAGTKFHKSDLFVNQDEVSIAEILSMAVKEYPSVSFGSYPQHSNRYYKVQLTIETDNPELLSKAVNRLKVLLPPTCLVDFDPKPLEFSFAKIENLCLEAEMTHVNAALQNVVLALSSSRIEDIALFIDASLMGVVTLHLVHAVWKKLERTEPITSIIIKNRDLIAQSNFLEDSVSRYSLRVIDEQCAIEAALPTLHGSCENLQLLVVGCECNQPGLAADLTSIYGDGKVSLLTPVSSWTEDQLLQFARKLNLPFLTDDGGKSPLGPKV